MKKLLVYTCCDKKYESFIPLYCLSLLTFNRDICIEIGVQEEISENCKNALNILKNEFGDVIQITKLNFTISNKKGYIIYNGIEMMANTLRFITTPQLKAEYVYISDIDIICMNPILECHLKHMKEINKQYSNIVRKGTVKLTGLHFSKYDFYYPLNLSNINLAANDEIILYQIVSKKTELDKDTTYRPVHGIHMSLNRPKVEGSDTVPGWCAFPYKQQWHEFSNSSIYKQLYKCFEGVIIEQIEKLNEFYKNI